MKAKNGQARTMTLNAHICCTYDTQKDHVRSFDLLRLQLDRLPINEDTLSFVRLRLPPHPDLSSKLQQDFLLTPLEQNSGRLRCAGCDTSWYRHLNWMRISNLQYNKFLSLKLRLNCCGSTFYCSSVSNSN